jgi:hypothetical protein
MTALYCGKECQTAAWPTHRKECRVLQGAVKVEHPLTLPEGAEVVNTDDESHEELAFIAGEDQAKLEAAAVRWLLSMPSFVGDLQTALRSHTDRTTPPAYLVSEGDSSGTYKLGTLVADEFNKPGVDSATSRYIKYWMRPSDNGEVDNRVTLLCVRNGCHCFLRLDFEKIAPMGTEE